MPQCSTICTYFFTLKLRGGSPLPIPKDSETFNQISCRMYRTIKLVWCERWFYESGRAPNVWLGAIACKVSGSKLMSWLGFTISLT